LPGEAATLSCDEGRTASKEEVVVDDADGCGEESAFVRHFVIS
jgi:hypothetical protein